MKIEKIIRGWYFRHWVVGWSMSDGMKSIWENTFGCEINTIFYFKIGRIEFEIHSNPSTRVKKDRP